MSKPQSASPTEATDDEEDSSDGANKASLFLASALAEFRSLNLETDYGLNVVHSLEEPVMRSLADVSSHHQTPQLSFQSTTSLDSHAWGLDVPIEPKSKLTFSSVSYHQPILSVPEAPAYLEQFSSFITTREPSEVLAQISAVLRNTRADCEAPTADFKMSCVLYDTVAGACHFRVHIFRLREGTAQGQGRYIVELQRRSGCVVAFSAFYRRLVAALGTIVCETFTPVRVTESPASSLSSPALPTGLLPPSLRPPALSSQLAPPSLHSASPSPATVAAPELDGSEVQLDVPTMEALVDMAASPQTDVQREALRALASAPLSSATSIQLLHVQPTVSSDAGEGSKCARTENDEPGAAEQHSDTYSRGRELLALLTKRLTSSDSEVARCSATVLGNLAQRVAVALLPFVEPLFSFLRSPFVNLASRETHRQVARALAAVCQQHGGEVLKQDSSHYGQFIAALENSRRSDDPSLVKAAMSCLVALSRASAV